MFILTIDSNVLTYKVIFLESGTVDLSTDEEEEAHPSSESKDDQSPASHSSSSLEEKEVSPIGW